MKFIISRSFWFFVQWLLLGAVTTVFGSKLPFVSKPNNHESTSGEAVILPCRIRTAGSDYAITWQKLVSNEAPVTLFVERVRMTDDERFEISVSNDSSNFDLKIKRLIVSDDGTYECSIMADPPLTQHQILHVRSPPTVNTVPEKSPAVVEMGGNIRLACISRGKPKPKITWKKLDGTLPKNLRLDKNPDELYFEGATEENAGTYRCTADNGVGNPVSADIVVELNNQGSEPHAPTVTVLSKIIEVRPAETFNVTCTYSANPAPTVEWFLNGYRIEPDSSKKQIIDLRRGSHSTTTLIIKDTTIDDFGDYSCRVFNTLGKAENTVSVTGLPEQARVKMEPNSLDGFSLHWYVDSAEPIIEYHLDYKEFGKVDYKTELIKADSATPAVNGKTYEGHFDVEKLQPETSYEFVIRARNKIGWGKPVQETITTGKLQDYRRQADSVYATKTTTKGNTGGATASFLSGPLVVLLATSMLFVLT